MPGGDGAAFGMDRILVETVGVGQTELDVMRLADTTVVVLVPEAGDAVQVMKAGLLEIADVFLVNKADREGAERMRSELAQMLHLRPAAAWSIPVLLTQAASDGGTAAVLDALEQHRAFLAADPERARRQRARREGELIDILLALRAREGLTTVFLRGNHEDMCLAYLGRGGQWGESWMMNGAPATLASYGVPLGLDGPPAAACLPPAHLEFLEGLLPWTIADRFLLVHAGIRPGRPLEQQVSEDVLWIREEFIHQPHDLPHTVVFGHTPRRT